MSEQSDVSHLFRTPVAGDLHFALQKPHRHDMLKCYVSDRRVKKPALMSNRINRGCLIYIESVPRYVGFLSLLCCCSRLYYSILK